MTIHPQALFASGAVLLLVLFVSYRRIRRAIGRQPLQPTRMKVRMAILAVVCAVFLVVPGLHAALLAAGATGAAAGVALAFYALKHTHFETTPDGVYYTSHPYIGLGIAALVIARVAYRMMQMNATMETVAAGGAPPPPMAGTIGNPLTTGVFFIMAGYYIAFYAGLLRNQPPPAQSAQ